jgi:hypothetical protein
MQLLMKHKFTSEERDWVNMNRDVLHSVPVKYSAGYYSDIQSSLASGDVSTSQYKLIDYPTCSTSGYYSTNLR